MKFLPHSAIFSLVTFFFSEGENRQKKGPLGQGKKRVCTLQKIKGVLFGIMQKPPRIF